MTFISRFAHGLAGAALTMAAFAAPAHALPVNPTAPGGGPVRVTDRDITASNQKIAAAFADLASWWQKEFQSIGEQFATPRIARYEGDVMSACGIMSADNAEYCPNNNTVYYDEVFVAGMQKTAANALGTDGDMAAIGIIAHEMGHAVAMQLGHEYPDSYSNEATADCLAGAFAQQAQREGSLEKGDIDEAFYGMSLSGDPTPQPTGNRRMDRMIQARLARNSHGTRDQRMQNFKAGLDGGPGACLAEFR